MNQVLSLRASSQTGVAISRQKGLLRKAFCLTSQLAPYRIHIRRQERVVRLDGFSDLCQSVKKEVF